MNSTIAIGRLRKVLRRQHKALSTQECYVFWLRRYMAALPTMPVGLPSEAKLERFLTELSSIGKSTAALQPRTGNLTTASISWGPGGPDRWMKVVCSDAGPLPQAVPATLPESRFGIGTIKVPTKVPTKSFPRRAFGAGGGYAPWGG